MTIIHPNYNFILNFSAYTLGCTIWLKEMMSGCKALPKTAGTQMATRGFLQIESTPKDAKIPISDSEIYTFTPWHKNI